MFLPDGNYAPQRPPRPTPVNEQILCAQQTGKFEILMRERTKGYVSDNTVFAVVDWLRPDLSEAVRAKGLRVLQHAGCSADRGVDL